MGVTPGRPEHKTGLSEHRRRWRRRTGQHIRAELPLSARPRRQPSKRGGSKPVTGLCLKEESMSMLISIQK